MDRGSTIGMDRYGSARGVDTEKRTDTVAELCRRGYSDRMVLSQDASAYFSHSPRHIRAERFPNYLTIATKVVPGLRSAASPKQIEQLTAATCAASSSSRARTRVNAPRSNVPVAPDVQRNSGGASAGGARPALEEPEQRTVSAPHPRRPARSCYRRARRRRQPRWRRRVAESRNLEARSSPEDACGSTRLGQSRGLPGCASSSSARGERPSRCSVKQRAPDGPEGVPKAQPLRRRVGVRSRYAHDRMAPAPDMLQSSALIRSGLPPVRKGACSFLLRRGVRMIRSSPRSHRVACEGDLHLASPERVAAR